VLRWGPGRDALSWVSDRVTTLILAADRAQKSRREGANVRSSGRKCTAERAQMSGREGAKLRSSGRRCTARVGARGGREGGTVSVGRYALGWLRGVRQNQGFREEPVRGMGDGVSGRQVSVAAVIVATTAPRRQ
jgi:hypothetical protein